ncbi:MAG TPA: DUF1257 domain-containing protein [Chloroflexi bacterium]|nr:DUF1257 domain-containing protein [Chloroflexota bacterium]
MSQIVRIRKTQMVEKEYLLQALQDLGYKHKEGGRLGLFGAKVDIKAAGYIGFRWVGGAYEMVSIGSAVRGPNELLQTLTQRYAYHVARAKLEAQGFTLANEEVREDGRIHLVLRRMA